MKPLATFVLTFLFAVPAVGVAQDSLLGRYNATYAVTGISARNISVSIVISSVEDGKISGTGIRGDKGCLGEYPLTGSIKDKEIRLRATSKGGPAGDCFFRFSGTVEGNTLVGKYFDREITFRK